MVFDSFPSLLVIVLTLQNASHRRYVSIQSRVSAFASKNMKNSNTSSAVVITRWSWVTVSTMRLLWPPRMSAWRSVQARMWQLKLQMLF